LSNINWKDVQIKNVVNNVDMSSFKGHHDKMARKKTNTENDTQTRTTSWRNRHVEKLYLCVFRIFLFFLFYL